MEILQKGSVKLSPKNLVVYVMNKSRFFSKWEKSKKDKKDKRSDAFFQKF